MTLRTALIGRGMAGTVFHAPLIRAVPELELVALAGAADAAAAIAAPGVDLVVVAAPNAAHFPLAAAALEAGRHVVVDKPIAVTLAEADSLIALAEAKGRLLTVFHNRRWDGDFLTVRGLLEAGRLGKLNHYSACWDRFRPAPKAGWREVPARGAGLLWDLGPHLIDQALLLFGRPDALSADIERQREGARVDDYFALTLHYGAMRVHLSASSLMAQPRPRFAIAGTCGNYSSHGLDPQESALKAGIKPLSPAFAAAGPTFRGTLSHISGHSELVPAARGRYLSFYESVASSILRGDPPPVDPADARAGLALIRLARRSARQGRRLALGQDR